MKFNLCFMMFKDDHRSQIFEDENLTFNFKEMTETVDGEVREIRRCEDTHVRTRAQDSDQVKAIFATERKEQKNHDLNSFKWLSENYERIHGRRNLTWKTVIKGIRNEHLYELKKQPNISEKEVEF